MSNLTAVLNTVQAVVESIDDVHADIRIVRVRPTTGTLTWKAGQYLQVTFASLPKPRYFSIGSAPHTGIPEFHISRTGVKGVSVSQHVADMVKAGDSVELAGPFGDAGIIAGDTLPLLMVAGGTGLPPMKAMVEDAIYRNDTRAITLYWGTETPEKMYLLDYFTQLAAGHSHFKFVPVIGTPVSQYLADNSGDLGGTRIYMAGRPEMIHASIEAALKNGADLQMIHTDDIPTFNKFRTPAP